MEDLGDFEDMAFPSCGSMLFITSYPSSNCFSSRCSACLDGNGEGWPSAAVAAFDSSSLKVMNGDGWDWQAARWASSSGAKLYGGSHGNID